MKYELECAHCGSLFVLEDGALPRQVRCPICGGALTVAIPVTVAAPPAPPAPVLAPPPPPEPPPEPPPPPPPPPPPVPLPPRVAPLPPPFAPAPAFPALFPSFTPARPDLHDLAPELRAAHLLRPWPEVRIGLDLARAAAYFAIPLFVLLAVGNLFVAPFAKPSDASFVQSAIMVLGLAQLFPVVLHTVGQLTCLRVPDSHGASRVRVSAFLQAGALGGAVSAAVVSSYTAAVLSAVAGFVSFGTWLSFLARLGQRLDDRPLMSAAWSYTSWFWAGLLIALSLAVGSYHSAREREVYTAWGFRAACAVILLLLMLGYTGLLRTASLAVARRGPVSAKS